MKATFPKLTLPDEGSSVAPTLGHPLSRVGVGASAAEFDVGRSTSASTWTVVGNADVDRGHLNRH